MIARNDPGRAAPAAPSGQHAGSGEVLLLDDDATMLGILDGVLTGAGFRCLVALDALTALDLIQARPQIAVVVSDVLMPGLGGLQFVDRLGALPLSQPPPRVLLLSGQPTFEAAVEALRLGVRDFLVKPVQPAELIAAVHAAMEQSRADRAGNLSRSPEIELLARQAEELVGRLRMLAYRAEMPGDTAPAGAAAIEPPASLATSAAVGSLAVLETIERLRRLRIQYEHYRLDDVAWDLLLELLRAERLRQRLSVSGLAISVAGVSATTALRRINELAARGFIARTPDPEDARRDFVALTERSQTLLAEYLAQANQYVSTLTA